ncbi:MAG: alpha/beta hydrolase [Pseudomonadota bacterium]
MNPLTNLYTFQQTTAHVAKPAGVLAIHGSASNSKMWRPLQAALHGAREVTTPDLDGYHSPPVQSDIEDRLEQLGAILQSQPGPMDVVAHSFGGAIALKLANVFPDRVSSVSIYDPVVPIRTGGGGSGLPADLQARFHQVDTLDGAGLMQSFFEYWGGTDAWHALPMEKRQRIQDYHPVFLRDLSELMSGKWTILRSRFKGPVTVFRGTKSKIATRQSCEQIVDTFAQASWIDLPGLDHLAPITNPDPVITALMSGLAPYGSTSDHHLTPHAKSAA